MDIIKLLKGESENTPSRVAFRNLGTPGDNVSVKYHNNEGWCANDYSWHHGTNDITESQARTLLEKLDTATNQKPAKDPDFYLYSNQYAIKRENGVVRLAKNGGIGVDAYGKWVLRDNNGEAVDMDKYLSDLIERHQEKLGEPVETNFEVERISLNDLVLLKPLPNTSFDQMMLNQELVIEPSERAGHHSPSQMAATSYSNRKITIRPIREQTDSLSDSNNAIISGNRDQSTPSTKSMEGRMIHTMRDSDSLTFAEALERHAREKGY